MSREIPEAPGADRRPTNIARAPRPHPALTRRSLVPRNDADAQRMLAAPRAFTHRWAHRVIGITAITAFAAWAGLALRGPAPTERSVLSRAGEAGLPGIVADPAIQMPPLLIDKAETRPDLDEEFRIARYPER